MQKLTNDIQSIAVAKPEFNDGITRLFTGGDVKTFARAFRGANIKSLAFERTGQPWLLTGALLHAVMLVHFVGGAMLTLGFLTRIAAAAQIPILAGAVFIVHRKDGLFAMGQSLEFSALVLFLLVVLFISGAGKLSLDYVTFGAGRSRIAEPDHEPAPQI